MLGMVDGTRKEANIKHTGLTAADINTLN